MARKPSIIVLLMLLGTCGSRNTGGANFSSQFTAEQDYSAMYNEWTRIARLQTYPSEAANVVVTFKSPPWWAAYAKRRIEKDGLTESLAEQFLAKKKEAYQEYYEFEVLLTTAERRENDLQKGKRSSWTLVLEDDKGNVAKPMSIQRDRRPEDMIRAEYPDYGDFARAYVVRFPRTFPLMAASADYFKLTVGSPRGKMELIWQNQK